MPGVTDSWINEEMGNPLKRFLAQEQKSAEWSFEHKGIPPLGKNTPYSPQDLDVRQERWSEIVQQGILDAVYYINCILTSDDSVIAFHQDWPVLVYDEKNTATWRRCSPDAVVQFKQAGWDVKVVGEGRYEFRR